MTELTTAPPPAPRPGAPGLTAAPPRPARPGVAALSAARAWPRRAPLTFGYLAVLALTTAVQLAVPPAARHALLAGSSTDVAHLATVPVRVLVASMLWLPDMGWARELALFALVLAPVEDRLGTKRLLLIFLAGHVLVTVLTEGPIAVGVATGHLPASARTRLDVGVSFGFWTVYPVRLWLARHRWTVLALAAGLLTNVLAPLLLDPEMTTWGHLLAVCTGTALAAAMRHRWSLPLPAWPVWPVRHGAPAGAGAVAATGARVGVRAGTGGGGVPAYPAEIGETAPAAGSCR